MQPFKYQPKVNSGNLRNRVDVYGNVKGTNAIGEVVYGYGKITSVWAEIVPQTGKLQTQQAETILTHVTHKINVRYNRLIMETYQDEQQKSSMYIKHNRRRFDIRFILDPFERREMLEIFVEEVIG